MGALKIEKNLYQTKNYQTIFDEALKIFKSIPANIHVDIVQTRAMSLAFDPMKKDDKDAIERLLFDPIMNALLSNMKKRSEVYEQLESNYSFLINLNSMSNEEIVDSCKNIVSKYPNDLNENQLINECEIAKNYFTFNKLTHDSMYKTMFNDNLCASFPNIDIFLRMYLSMFVTNVSDERSFSKLKLIKNYLRNTIGDDRLNSLSILAIEYEVLDNLNFDEIIDEFVSLKNRKVQIT